MISLMTSMNNRAPLYLTAILLIFLKTTPAAAEDFRLGMNGVGPIPVSLKVHIRNKKDELTAFPREVAEVTATARNDSRRRIRYAKFCVQAERRTDGCDFKFSIKEMWEPGEEIVWMVDGASRRGIDKARISLLKLEIDAPRR